MEINSVQGINAYNIRPQEGNTAPLEEQNRSAARSDLTSQEVQQAREAFEVNISQEARRLTRETQPPQADQPPAEPPEGPAQTASRPDQAAAQQQASQIVNIVA